MLDAACIEVLVMVSELDAATVACLAAGYRCQCTGAILSQALRCSKTAVCFDALRSSVVATIVILGLVVMARLLSQLLQSCESSASLQGQHCSLL